MDRNPSWATAPRTGAITSNSTNTASPNDVSRNQQGIADRSQHQRRNGSTSSDSSDGEVVPPPPRPRLVHTKSEKSSSTTVAAAATPSSTVGGAGGGGASGGGQAYPMTGVAFHNQQQSAEYRRQMQGGEPRLSHASSSQLHTVSPRANNITGGNTLHQHASQPIASHTTGSGAQGDDEEDDRGRASYHTTSAMPYHFTQGGGYMMNSHYTSDDMLNSNTNSIDPTDDDDDDDDDEAPPPPPPMRVIANRFNDDSHRSNMPVTTTMSRPTSPADPDYFQQQQQQEHHRDGAYAAIGRDQLFDLKSQQSSPYNEDSGAVDDDNDGDDDDDGIPPPPPPPPLISGTTMNHTPNSIAPGAPLTITISNLDDGEDDDAFDGQGALPIQNQQRISTYEPVRRSLFSKSSYLQRLPPTMGGAPASGQGSQQGHVPPIGGSVTAASKLLGSDVLSQAPPQSITSHHVSQHDTLSSSSTDPASDTSATPTHPSSFSSSTSYIPPSSQPAHNANYHVVRPNARKNIQSIFGDGHSVVAAAPMNPKAMKLAGIDPSASTPAPGSASHQHDHLSTGGAGAGYAVNANQAPVQEKKESKLKSIIKNLRKERDDKGGKSSKDATPNPVDSMGGSSGGVSGVEPPVDLPPKLRALTERGGRAHKHAMQPTTNTTSTVSGAGATGSSQQRLFDYLRPEDLYEASLRSAKCSLCDGYTLHQTFHQTKIQVSIRKETFMYKCLDCGYQPPGENLLETIRENFTNIAEFYQQMNQPCVARTVGLDQQRQNLQHPHRMHYPAIAQQSSSLRSNDSTKTPLEEELRFVPRDNTLVCAKCISFQDTKGKCSQHFNHFLVNFPLVPMARLIYVVSRYLSSEDSTLTTSVPHAVHLIGEALRPVYINNALVHSYKPIPNLAFVKSIKVPPRLEYVHASSLYAMVQSGLTCGSPNLPFLGRIVAHDSKGDKYQCIYRDKCPRLQYLASNLTNPPPGGIPRQICACMLYTGSYALRSTAPPVASSSSSTSSSTATGGTAGATPDADPMSSKPRPIVGNRQQGSKIAALTGSSLPIQTKGGSTGPGAGATSAAGGSTWGGNSMNPHIHPSGHCTDSRVRWLSYRDVCYLIQAVYASLFTPVHVIRAERSDAATRQLQQLKAAVPATAPSSASSTSPIPSSTVNANGTKAAETSPHAAYGSREEMLAQKNTLPLTLALSSNSICSIYAPNSVHSILLDTLCASTGIVTAHIHYQHHSSALCALELISPPATPHITQQLHKEFTTSGWYPSEYRAHANAKIHVLSTELRPGSTGRTTVSGNMLPAFYLPSLPSDHTQMKLSQFLEFKLSQPFLQLLSTLKAMKVGIFATTPAVATILINIAHSQFLQSDRDYYAKYKRYREGYQQRNREIIQEMTADKSFTCPFYYDLHIVNAIDLPSLKCVIILHDVPYFYQFCGVYYISIGTLAHLGFTLADFEVESLDKRPFPTAEHIQDLISYTEKIDNARENMVNVLRDNEFFNDPKFTEDVKRLQSEREQNLCRPGSNALSVHLMYENQLMNLKQSRAYDMKSIQDEIKRAERTLFNVELPKLSVEKYPFLYPHPQATAVSVAGADATPPSAEPQTAPRDVIFSFTMTGGTTQQSQFHVDTADTITQSAAQLTDLSDGSSMARTTTVDLPPPPRFAILGQQSFANAVFGTTNSSTAYRSDDYGYENVHLPIEILHEPISHFNGKSILYNTIIRHGRCCAYSHIYDQDSDLILFKYLRIIALSSSLRDSSGGFPSSASTIGAHSSHRFTIVSSFSRPNLNEDSMLANAATTAALTDTNLLSSMANTLSYIVPQKVSFFWLCSHLHPTTISAVPSIWASLLDLYHSLYKKLFHVLLQRGSSANAFDSVSPQSTLTTALLDLQPASSKDKSSSTTDTSNNKAAPTARQPRALQMTSLQREQSLTHGFDKLLTESTHDDGAVQLHPFALVRGDYDDDDEDDDDDHPDHSDALSAMSRNKHHISSHTFTARHLPPLVLLNRVAGTLLIAYLRYRLGLRLRAVSVGSGKVDQSLMLFLHTIARGIYNHKSIENDYEDDMHHRPSSGADYVTSMDGGVLGTTTSSSPHHSQPRLSKSFDSQLAGHSMSFSTFHVSESIPILLHDAATVEYLGIDGGWKLFLFDRLNDVTFQRSVQHIALFTPPQFSNVTTSTLQETILPKSKLGGKPTLKITPPPHTEPLQPALVVSLAMASHLPILHQLPAISAYEMYGSTETGMISLNHKVMSSRRTVTGRTSPTDAVNGGSGGGTAASTPTLEMKLRNVYIHRASGTLLYHNIDANGDMIRSDIKRTLDILAKHDVHPLYLANNIDLQCHLSLNTGHYDGILRGEIIVFSTGKALGYHTSTEQQQIQDATYQQLIRTLPRDVVQICSPHQPFLLNGWYATRDLGERRYRCTSLSVEGSKANHRYAIASDDAITIVGRIDRIRKGSDGEFIDWGFVESIVNQSITQPSSSTAKTHSSSQAQSQPLLTGQQEQPSADIFRQIQTMDEPSDMSLTTIQPTVASKTIKMTQGVYFFLPGLDFPETTFDLKTSEPIKSNEVKHTQRQQQTPNAVCVVQISREALLLLSALGQGQSKAASSTQPSQHVGDNDGEIQTMVLPSSPTAASGPQANPPTTPTAAAASSSSATAVSGPHSLLDPPVDNLERKVLPCITTEILRKPFRRDQAYIITDPTVITYYKHLIHTMVTEQLHLSQSHVPDVVLVVLQNMSVDTGSLTITGKVNRANIIERYYEDIQRAMLQYIKALSTASRKTANQHPTGMPQLGASASSSSVDSNGSPPPPPPPPRRVAGAGDALSAGPVTTTAAHHSQLPPLTVNVSDADSDDGVEPAGNVSAAHIARRPRNSHASSSCSSDGSGHPIKHPCIYCHYQSTWDLNLLITLVADICTFIGVDIEVVIPNIDYYRILVQTTVNQMKLETSLHRKQGSTASTPSQGDRMTPLHVYTALTTLINHNSYLQLPLSTIGVDSFSNQRVTSYCYRQYECLLGSMATTSCSFIELFDTINHALSTNTTKSSHNCHTCSFYRPTSLQQLTNDNVALQTYTSTTYTQQQETVYDTLEKAYSSPRTSSAASPGSLLSPSSRAMQATISEHDPDVGNVVPITTTVLADHLPTLLLGRSPRKSRASSSRSSFAKSTTSATPRIIPFKSLRQINQGYYARFSSQLLQYLRSIGAHAQPSADNLLHHSASQVTSASPTKSIVFNELDEGVRLPLASLLTPPPFSSALRHFSDQLEALHSITRDQKFQLRSLLFQSSKFRRVVNQNVILTGATGLVGMYMLRQLLFDAYQSPDSTTNGAVKRIIALVRIGEQDLEEFHLYRIREQYEAYQRQVQSNLQTGRPSIPFEYKPLCDASHNHEKLNPFSPSNEKHCVYFRAAAAAFKLQNRLTAANLLSHDICTSQSVHCCKNLNSLCAYRDTTLNRDYLTQEQQQQLGLSSLHDLAGGGTTNVSTPLVGSGSSPSSVSLQQLFASTNSSRSAGAGSPDRMATAPPPGSPTSNQSFRNQQYQSYHSICQCLFAQVIVLPVDVGDEFIGLPTYPEFDANHPAQIAAASKKPLPRPYPPSHQLPTVVSPSSPQYTQQLVTSIIDDWSQLFTFTPYSLLRGSVNAKRHQHTLPSFISMALLTSAIYNCAAEVDHLAGFTKLYQSNIQSVCNLALIAAIGKHIRLDLFQESISVVKQQLYASVLGDDSAGLITNLSSPTASSTLLHDNSSVPGSYGSESKSNQATKQSSGVGSFFGRKLGFGSSSTTTGGAGGTNTSTAGGSSLSNNNYPGGQSYKSMKFGDLVAYDKKLEEDEFNRYYMCDLSIKIYHLSTVDTIDERSQDASPMSLRDVFALQSPSPHQSRHRSSSYIQNRRKTGAENIYTLDDDHQLDVGILIRDKYIDYTSLLTDPTHSNDYTPSKHQPKEVYLYQISTYNQMKKIPPHTLSRPALPPNAPTTHHSTTGNQGVSSRATTSTTNDGGHIAEVSIIQDASLLEPHAFKYTGYRQTKWVAERFLTGTCREWDIPLLVFNCGHITIPWGSNNSQAYQGIDSDHTYFKNVREPLPWPTPEIYDQLYPYHLNESKSGDSTVPHVSTTVGASAIMNTSGGGTEDEQNSVNPAHARLSFLGELGDMPLPGDVEMLTHATGSLQEFQQHSLYGMESNDNMLLPSLVPAEMRSNLFVTAYSTTAATPQPLGDKDKKPNESGHSLVPSASTQSSLQSGPGGVDSNGIKDQHITTASSSSMGGVIAIISSQQQQQQKLYQHQLQMAEQSQQEKQGQKSKTRHLPFSRLHISSSNESNQSSAGNNQSGGGMGSNTSMGGGGLYTGGPVALSSNTTWLTLSPFYRSKINSDENNNFFSHSGIIGMHSRFINPLCDVLPSTTLPTIAPAQTHIMLLSKNSGYTHDANIFNVPTTPTGASMRSHNISGRPSRDLSRIFDIYNLPDGISPSQVTNERLALMLGSTSTSRASVSNNSGSRFNSGKYNTIKRAGALAASGNQQGIFPQQQQQPSGGDRSAGLASGGAPSSPSAFIKHTSSTMVDGAAEHLSLQTITPETISPRYRSPSSVFPKDFPHALLSSVGLHGVLPPLTNKLPKPRQYMDGSRYDTDIRMNLYPVDWLVLAITKIAQHHHDLPYIYPVYQPRSSGSYGDIGSGQAMGTGSHTTLTTPSHHGLSAHIPATPQPIMSPRTPRAAPPRPPPSKNEPMAPAPPSAVLLAFSIGEQLHPRSAFAALTEGCLCNSSLWYDEHRPLSLASVNQLRQENRPQITQGEYSTPLLLATMKQTVLRHTHERILTWENALNTPFQSSQHSSSSSSSFSISSTARASTPSAASSHSIGITPRQSHQPPLSTRAGGGTQAKEKWNGVSKNVLSHLEGDRDLSISHWYGNGVRFVLSHHEPVSLLTMTKTCSAIGYQHLMNDIQTLNSFARQFCYQEAYNSYAQSIHSQMIKQSQHMTSTYVVLPSPYVIDRVLLTARVSIDIQRLLYYMAQHYQRQKMQYEQQQQQQFQQMLGGVGTTTGATQPPSHPLFNPKHAAYSYQSMSTGSSNRSEVFTTRTDHSSGLDSVGGIGGGAGGNTLQPSSTSTGLSSMGPNGASSTATSHRKRSKPSVTLLSENYVGDIPLLIPYTQDSRLLSIAATYTNWLATLSSPLYSYFTLKNQHHQSVMQSPLVALFISFLSVNNRIGNDLVYQSLSTHLLLYHLGVTPVNINTNPVLMQDMLTMITQQYIQSVHVKQITNQRNTALMAEKQRFNERNAAHAQSRSLYSNDDVSASSGFGGASGPTPAQRVSMPGHRIHVHTPTHNNTIMPATTVAGRDQAQYLPGQSNRLQQRSSSMLPSSPNGYSSQPPSH